MLAVPTLPSHIQNIMLMNGALWMVLYGIRQRCRSDSVWVLGPGFSVVVVSLVASVLAVPQ